MKLFSFLIQALVIALICDNIMTKYLLVEVNGSEETNTAGKSLNVLNYQKFSIP